MVGLLEQIRGRSEIKTFDGVLDGVLALGVLGDFAGALTGVLDKFLGVWSEDFVALEGVVTLCGHGSSS